MPTIPDEFSVVPLHQEIPKAILAEIDTFIDVFDRVTTRAVCQDAVTAGTRSPVITRTRNLSY